MSTRRARPASPAPRRQCGGLALRAGRRLIIDWLAHLNTDCGREKRRRLSGRPTSPRPLRKARVVAKILSPPRIRPKAATLTPASMYAVGLPLVVMGVTGAGKTPPRAR